MKKSALKFVTSAAVLALLSMPLSAFAANIAGTAKVSPKTGLSLNFDSFSFAGAVGDNNLSATYKLGAATEAAPKFTVRAKTNYSVMISGSKFANAGNTIQLDIERLKVSVAAGAPSSVTATPTTIDGASGVTNTSKAISYTLDLTDAANTYSDNTTIDSLTADTDVTTTVVLSFTGV